MRCNMDGCAGAWALPELSSCKERLRVGGIFQFVGMRVVFSW